MSHRTTFLFSGPIWAGRYRTRDDGPDSLTAKLFRSSFCREIRIKFVGVWDTVGALGIPLEVVDPLVQGRRKADPSYEPQNNGLPRLS